MRILLTDCTFFYLLVFGYLLTLFTFVNSIGIANDNTFYHFSYL